MSLDDLIEAARAGDAKANERLVKELRPDLVNYFRRRSRPSVAEDLAQQTLMIVLRESKAFKSTRPGAFRSFVFETAYNQLRTYRRRESLRRRDRDAPGTWTVEPGPGVSEAMLELERRRLFHQALEIVRSTFRRVLESRMRGESPREYAKTEGIKPDSVRVRVWRAIMAVREVLAAGGYPLGPDEAEPRQGRRKTRGPTPKPG